MEYEIEKISELDALTTADNSDELIINDVSEEDTMKITKQNLLKEVNTSITSLNTGKQDTLVSGTNIKTVNSNSLLGSGNLLVKDIEYRDWSQQFSCSQGMTNGTVTVPTISGYTCIANVLRSTSSNYMIYELSANGAVKIYNHSSGTLTVTIYGRFIYVRNA